MCNVYNSKREILHLRRSELQWERMIKTVAKNESYPLNQLEVVDPLRQLNMLLCRCSQNLFFRHTERKVDKLNE